MWVHHACVHTNGTTATQFYSVLYHAELMWHSKHVQWEIQERTCCIALAFTQYNIILSQITGIKFKLAIKF